MSLDYYRRLTNEIFGEATHPIDKYIVRPFNAGGWNSKNSFSLKKNIYMILLNFFGIASIIAWSIIWPLEFMRTQVQANYLDEKYFF